MGLPALVATDLDGTLLRADNSISPRTAEVLGRITAAGTHVVLVTGRPVRWLAQVYAQLPAAPPAVCANGAVVYDPVADELLRTDPLDPVLLARVCGKLREAIPEAVFAVELEGGRSMRHEVAYPVRWDTDNPAVRSVGSLAELLAQPATKLLIRAPGRGPDEFLAEVMSYVEGLVEATHSSAGGLVEISAAGVTKAAGLAWLCDRLGVAAADVLAFGDMPNDVPMLAWAGRSVCVANAHDAVHAVADEVTLSNDDDGVAVFLAELLAQPLHPLRP